MSATITVERASDDKLHLRRWLFSVRFAVRGVKPTLAMELIGYDEGTRPTPRHRNLTFSDRRRWAGRYFRTGGVAQQRFDCWCDMTKRAELSDTRWAKVCEPPPLPKDVAEEAMKIVVMGMSVSVPEAKDLPEEPR